MKTLWIATLCGAALTASVAVAAPAMQGQTMMGVVLTDDMGMTLYTFDKDLPGVSTCIETCASFWPALTAMDNAMAEGDYTIIKRTDGSLQWAYKGKPLYRWSKDAKPGDTNGNGFKDLWHVAKP